MRQECPTWSGLITKNLSLLTRRYAVLPLQALVDHMRQQVCVVGGLDVTCGRWDTRDHVLVDKDRRLFPGLDYYVTELGGAPVSWFWPSPG